MRLINLFIPGLLCLISCNRNVNTKGLVAEDKTSEANKEFVTLYNGKNLDNWYCVCRGDNKDLPQDVFTAGENGEMHVFKNFPDEGDENLSGNNTHCMFFTTRKYSKYIFRFEYKWGEKTYNNFKQFQYDAGLYYHVYDRKIWPKGIEYQVRYNHIDDQNHTGDIWNSQADFNWIGVEDPDTNIRTYKSKENGGMLLPHKQGEHRALNEVEVHNLDGQWNQCEVIVMGDQYAIHKLNGQVVNVLTDLKPGEGYVGLQAETAEIYYRNIEIKEFSETIPMEEFLK